MEIFADLMDNAGNGKGTATNRNRTPREVNTDRNKVLEVPSSQRTIPVILASDGGRVIYVSDPRRARVLERADKFLTRQRAYKR